MDESLKNSTIISIQCDSNLYLEFVRVLSKQSESDIHTLLWDDEDMIKSEIYHLVLVSNNISNYSVISKHFDNLLCLNLSYNNIKDLNCISHLHSLQHLDISNNKLTSLDFVSGMTSLTTLRCNNNAVDSVEYLKGNLSLTELYLHNNKIPWTQLIFLSTLVKLLVLTKHANYCVNYEEKPKLNEFVMYLIPSLVILDGMRITTTTMASQGTPLGSTTVSKDPSTPITMLGDTVINKQQSMVDMKIMLTQAKSLCKLNAHQTQQDEKKEQQLKNKRAKSGRGKLAASTILEGDDEDSNSVTGGTGKLKLTRQSSNNSINTADTASTNDSASYSSSQTARSATGNKTQKNKPNKQQSKVKNAKNNSTTTHLNSSGELMSSVPIENNLVNEEEGGGQEFGEIVDLVANLPYISPDSSSQKSTVTSNQKSNKMSKKQPKSAQQARQTESLSNTESTPINTHTAVSTVPETMIKFQTHIEDSPVAMCVYGNKDGFVRWSRNGPQACSMEKGRLFASYKTGAIALVHDMHTGHGSLMDTRGRCLLVIHNHNTAKILDIKGNTVKEYTKSTTSSIASMHSDKDDGTAGSSDALDKMKFYLCDVDYENSNSTTTKLKHIWNIEGLKMEFKPDTWEITLHFQNERVQCEFSSVHGCTLVKEKAEVINKKTNTPKLKPNSSTSSNTIGTPHNATTSATSSNTTVSAQDTEALESQHSAMRSDILNLNLDEMLAGIKGLKIN